MKESIVILLTAPVLYLAASMIRREFDLLLLSWLGKKAFEGK